MSKARENVFLQIQVHRMYWPLNVHIIDQGYESRNPEHMAT